MKVFAPNTATGHAIQLVAETGADGKALRLERRIGENPTGHGDRAQVQWSGRTEEVAGGGLLGLRMRVKFLESPSSTNWNVKGWQWHAKANGSPSLGFYRYQNKWRLVANRWGITSSGSVGIIQYNVVLWEIDLSTKWNQWMAVDVLFNASNSDTTGYVELWLDGVQQTMKNGQSRYYVRTAPPSSVGCYSIFTDYAQSGTPAGVTFCDFFGLAKGGLYPTPAAEPEPEPPVDPPPPPVDPPDPPTDPTPPPAPVDPPVYVGEIKASIQIIEARLTKLEQDISALKRGLAAAAA